MLYGEKTTLRPVEAKDADLINRWLHDPALSGDDVPLAQYHLPLPPQSDAAAKIFIVQAKGKAVGLMAVRWPYGHRTPVDLVGGIADPRERGQGLGTDALVTLLHYLFDTQPVTRLSIRCAVRNKPARRWLESLGFKLDGIERELFYFGGAFQDVALYGMTRGDFDGRWTKGAPAAPPKPRESAPEALPAPGRDRPVRLSPERMAAERPARDADHPRDLRPRDEREDRPRRGRPADDDAPRERRPARAHDDEPPRRERDDRPPRRDNDRPRDRDDDRGDAPPRRSRFRI